MGTAKKASIENGTRAKNEKKKRNWFRLRRKTRKEKKVEIINDEQPYYNSSSKSFSVVSSSSAEEASPYHYDRNRVMNTESRLRKHIKELSESIPVTKSFTRFDEPSQQCVRLRTTSGVLLFEGVNENIPDDESFKNIIQEESRIRKKSGKKKETNFVHAPKDYNPVTSGFIRPKIANEFSFYDSDEDDIRQAEVKYDFEIVRRHDGSLVISS